MKWGLWARSKSGVEPIDTCEADSHAEAFAKFQRHATVSETEMIVEPMAKPGQCHDSRHYSQSGPVLSQKDL